MAVLWAMPAWSLTETGRALATDWTWPPFVWIPLLLTAVLYGIGITKMLRRTTRRRSLLWPILWFALGWISLVIALDSPLHELGEQLFWVHMTQHEILMLISAPLLVLGRPLIAFLVGHAVKLARVGRQPWALTNLQETLGLRFGPALGMVGIRIGTVDLAYSVLVRSNIAQRLDSRARNTRLFWQRH